MRRSRAMIMGLGLLAAAAAVDAATPGSAAAQAIVRIAPPPLRYEPVPVPPRGHWAWVPGHWRWVGNGYAWVPGRYVQPGPR